MTHKQRDLIAELGMRCLDPKSVIEDITAFVSWSRSVLKDSALELIPKDMTIGRVSVKEPFFANLFGCADRSGDRDVGSAPITKELAISLNHALDSNFQFFDAGGWH